MNMLHVRGELSSEVHILWKKLVAFITFWTLFI